MYRLDRRVYNKKGSTTSQDNTMVLERKKKSQSDSGRASLVRSLGKPKGRHKVSLIAVGILLITSVGLAAPSVLHIQIEGFSPYYFPKTAEVSVGTPVFWENPTSSHHTITHDGCKTGGFCVFDSGSIAPNGKFGLYHLPPGRYSYHCSLHPIMQGTLVVTNSSVLSET